MQWVPERGRVRMRYGIPAQLSNGRSRSTSWTAAAEPAVRLPRLGYRFRGMGNRTEIAWFRRVDGDKVDVRARPMGDVWVFASRVGRGNMWQPLEKPTLEDWLQLLDGVRRRIGRHRKQPEEEKRLVMLIREQFPDADVR